MLYIKVKCNESVYTIPSEDIERVELYNRYDGESKAWEGECENPMFVVVYKDCPVGFQVSSIDGVGEEGMLVTKEAWMSWGQSETR